MTASAFMRALAKSETPLELEQDHEPYMVRVPGFGVLLVAPSTGGWRALLVQPDPEGRFSPKSRHVPRAVKVIDGRLEIDMLHKADRLTVVLTPEVNHG